ncbi:50S ribosomal protein L15 [Marinoscillum sp. 108]|jgi:large subunit ribosomal protein L15|uniref:Large ribosomal subunit protein uL15 n=1 Tax=Marinoscillum luteum TaxID=861051 RepID=A0ABW7N920_9BACT|nr:50S ribosomal protein L15 [Marinoscillum sp. 108]VXD17092.1 50S ribosomal subunit protein L15 [Marinoscillum sp. 108]
MKLESLKPASGATKNRKKIARGQGSGKGGTATRGHKGAQSRSGYSRKIGFEGGQMPLQRRVPKFGFKNNNKIVMKPLNLDDLQALSEAKKLTEITPEILRENGLAQKSDKIKVLGRGELKAKLTVKAHKFSKTAQEAIEKAGGTASVEK